MPRPELDIRSATPDEMPVAVSTIVAAFITDPVTRFALPKPHVYLGAMPALVRAFTSEAFEHGAAFVTPCFRGAALWLPPGAHFDEEALATIIQEGAPPEHLPDLLATLEQMGKSHPDEPHWYLPMIGVEPYAQGQGLGDALMRHAVKRCDEEGLLAYLESTNPRNISLYERHGFEIMTRIQIGDVPPVAPMLRRPR